MRPLASLSLGPGTAWIYLRAYIGASAPLLSDIREDLFSCSQVFFVCQPKTVQDAAERRAVYLDAMDCPEFAHQRIECQIALRRNPLPHP